MTLIQGVYILIGAVLIVFAVLAAMDVPFVTKSFKKAYTEESVRRYTKNNLPGEIILGAGAILYAFPVIPRGLCWGMLLLGFVLSFWMRRTLVRLDDGKPAEPEKKLSKKAAKKAARKQRLQK